jgi:hypothetical protein
LRAKSTDREGGNPKKKKEKRKEQKTQKDVQPM